MNMAPGGTASLVELRKVLLDAPAGQPAPRLRRRRPHAPLRVVVQPRLPRAAAHRLGHAGLDPREAHHLRGRPRDPGLPRPQATARARPPLLRLLPSRASRRAARVRGGGLRGRAAVLGGADPFARRASSADPRKARCAVFYSITSCQPGLQGHLVRQFPHQAGGAGPPRGAAQPAPVRDALAHARDSAPG